MCSYATKVKADLLVHEKRHSEMRCYKCATCGHRSKTSGDLKKHELRHSDIRYANLWSCFLVYSGMRESLFYWAVHRRMCIVACRRSDFGSIKNTVLCVWIHTWIHNATDMYFVILTWLNACFRPYKCDMCDFTTKQASCLRTHKTRHSSKKPFTGRSCVLKTKSATGLFNDVVSSRISNLALNR